MRKWRQWRTDTLSCGLGDRRQSSDEAVFTVQGVNLEARHLLGQDGLGQVEKSRVVNREVAVITIQQPDSCPLDTETQSKYRSDISCSQHTGISKDPRRAPSSLRSRSNTELICCTHYWEVTIFWPSRYVKPWLCPVKQVKCDQHVSTRSYRLVL